MCWFKKWNLCSSGAKNGERYTLACMLTWKLYYIMYDVYLVVPIICSWRPLLRFLRWPVSARYGHFQVWWQWRLCEFCTRWIDGIECGLFLIHVPHGQTTLHVGWVWDGDDDDDDDDDDEWKGEGETRCRLIACSSLKAPRGPPGLTSSSDGRIAINSTYYMPSQHIYCGRVWNLIQVCDVQSSD